MTLNYNPERLKQIHASKLFGSTMGGLHKLYRSAIIPSRGSDSFGELKSCCFLVSPPTAKIKIEILNDILNRTHRPVDCFFFPCAM